MSERLPGDVHAKLDSRDSGASRVWDRWCRAVVGRPSSLQVGADALGKGGVRGDAARETVALRAEACGEEPVPMVVLRAVARRTFRDPAKSSNFGFPLRLWLVNSPRKARRPLVWPRCSAELVQLVSLLRAFRQPCHRCRVLPLRTCFSLSLNHH